MPIMSINDFGGGLWLPESSQLPVPPTALLQAKNIEYFSGGDGAVKIRGRRARRRLNTDTAFPGAIRTIYRHYPPTGSPSTLVAYEDGGVVKFNHDTDNDGRMNGLASSFNAQTGQKWRFVNFPQKGVSYGVNGYNGLRSYNGTALAQVTLSGGVFAATNSDIGPFLAVWKRRLWVTKRDQIAYSVYASALDSDSSFPPSNHLRADDPEGGDIVGIVPWNDVLLIFKTTRIFRFVGSIENVLNSQLTPFSNYGCVAPDTIRTTPYGVMYLARDGLRVTDGHDSIGVDLSAPLRSLFVSPATQSLYPNALGCYAARKHQYFLKLDSSSLAPYVLQKLEVSPEGARWAWSHFTGEGWTTITELAVGEAEGDNGIIYAGDSAGKFWELDAATLNQDDDNGTLSPIDIVVQTPYLPMHPQLWLGRATRCQLVYRGSSSARVALRYNALETADAHLFSIGAEWPDARMQIRERAIPGGRNHGQYLSTEITLSQDSHQAELHHILVHVAMRGPLARRVHW